jgi:predicted Holliday junction resolvase-like endonuclease
MKDNNLFKFFSLQRQIFGVCPHTGNIFRLSDCNIYLKKKPEHDWMKKLDIEYDKISKAEQKLDETEDRIREAAKERGRREASKKTKKIDKIFSPLKLNADDSKVIFHPVDFIVFNGIKKVSPNTKLKEILLLDSKKRTPDKKRLQQSIDKVIQQDNYEWITMRVLDNGDIKEE